MKEYNRKKWWIASDIVRDKYIEAENLNIALKQYQEDVKNKDYITISENALKNKNAMYMDKKDGTSKQIGYVITGKTSFQNDDGTWKDDYIDLWITIHVINTPDF